MLPVPFPVNPLDLLGPRCPRCGGPCYEATSGAVACASASCAWIAAARARLFDAPEEAPDVPRSGLRAHEDPLARVPTQSPLVLDDEA